MSNSIKWFWKRAKASTKSGNLTWKPWRQLILVIFLEIKSILTTGKFMESSWVGLTPTNDTIRLFAYGNLLNEEVHIHSFRTVLHITPMAESVSDWKLETTNNGDEDLYPVKSDGSILLGQIVLIPTDLITKLDDWKGGEYERIAVTTKSGLDCFMFTKKNY